MGVSLGVTSKRKFKRPPASWQADYPIIKELRKNRDAPVDHVGYHRASDFNFLNALELQEGPVTSAPFFHVNPSCLWQVHCRLHTVGLYRHERFMLV